MKSNTFLKRGTSSLQGTSSLNRGNSRLGSQTRIRHSAGRSGRMIHGVEIWSLQEADKKIKEFIFKRDGNKCVVTGDLDFLTPAHYHGRGNYAVRFDPDNLITLQLFKHDEWETKEMKETEHKDFMIKFLGEKRFKHLNWKASRPMNKEKSIIECMKFLGALPVSEKNNENNENNQIQSVVY